MQNSLKIVLAEALGTFFLVLIGCGAAVLAGKSLGLLGVAMAFGFTLLVLAYAIGPISGCHINPAVSFGMWIAGHLNTKDLIGYVIAQFLGACAGGYVLLTIATGNSDFMLGDSNLAVTGFGDHSPLHYSMQACIVAEIAGTFLLVFTVLSTMRRNFPTGFGGLAVGLALFMAILLAGNVTNASINPARSLGVAIFQGGWALEQMWFFIVMPLIGALLATFVHKAIEP